MTTKKNFVFTFISLFAMLLTALGISFAFPSQKADSAIDWTGHSYTKFTPYSTTDGVYLSPIEDKAQLGFVVMLVGGYSLIGGSYNGFMTTSAGATCGIDGTTYEGAQHQGTNTNYYDIRYRIEAYAQSNVYIRQARVAAKNASGFYALYTDTDYGINSTTTSFEYGQTVDRDDKFGTVEGSGAYDINMLYDLVLVYEYFINGNSVRVSAGSVADELAGGLGAATTVNPADYERDGYALEGFWTGENKTGTQVLDADGYFVNDYAYTPGATLYPGYTQTFYFDINNTLDGKDNEASQYFTFSLDVDGETVAQNVNDFYQPIKVGHSIEVYDIECVDGYSFAGYNASNSSAVNSSSTSSHIYVTMPEEEMVITLNFMSGAFWTDDKIRGDSFGGGTGTVDDPYIIATAKQLAFLSWTIYSGNEYEVISDDNNYYNGIYFLQTANIDLSSYFWQPIGTDKTREGTSVSRFFSGNYDGNGFSITSINPGNGYNISNSISMASCQGLFGITSRASIKNLSVEVYNNNYTYSLDYCGGIVGSASATTIINCHSSGDFMGRTSVGGIVGNASGSQISYCTNYADVSSYTSSSATIEKSGCGGIVGHSQSTIVNGCINYSNLSVGSVRGGGIVGYGERTTDIYNCRNLGDMIGTPVGGIAGMARNIYNCSNEGDIFGNSFKGYAGGIAGSATNVFNCYNSGDIVGHEVVDYVGGIVGSVTLVYNCFNTGSVTDAGDYVGGIAGQAQNLVNTYNLGMVSAQGLRYKGGLLGYKTSSSITNFSSNNYYGGDCEASIGGINGADVDGQAEYLADLDVLAKLEEWYSADSVFEDGSLVWDEEYPWDFENVWAIYGETVNEGYPVFIRYWTDIYYTFDNYVFSGAGTQADPYLIETPQQLAYLSWTIYSGSAHNGQSITINGENYYYQNSCFRQTANIDLSAGYWQPIGIFSTRESSEIVNRYFAGNYDGNGYIITGINIPEDTEYSYQGLFGVVKGNITDASVTNVAIYNSNIHGLEYVGGIAGYVGANASVTNSFYQGGVYGSSSGGIVGQVEGGEVSSSGFEGDVSAGVSAIAGVISNGGLVDSCYGIAEAPAQSGIAMYGQIDGGTIQNSLSICHDGDVTSKNYIGSDFSEFVWLNTDSSPIPRSLTWIGSIWPGSVTVDMLSSSGWTEIVLKIE